MRIFVGIPISDASKNWVVQGQKQLIPWMTKGRLTDPDLFHITLLFIGEMTTDQVEAWDRKLNQLFADERSFEVSFLNFGLFKKREDVLWIGVHQGSERLYELHKKVLESYSTLNLQVINPSFHPHLTIARNVKLGQQFDINSLSLSEKKLNINCIHIYLSHQVDGKLTYTPLYTYRLQ
ncbi:MAG: RNA 2',3'-cyclic phosphodiesterase [Acholeplasmataceae bacterium]|nr:RNA 2',3'-cyclic phosphodiesterase [Acholeplasmataceae bacterium]